MHTSDFTDDVLVAFKKRARAIRYRAEKVEVDRVKEVREGAESAIRRLDLKVSCKPWGNFHLAVWGDRWVWLHGRRRSKSGLLWSATVEGRFVGKGGARHLVDLLEATLSAPHSERPREVIEDIWIDYLARGPQRI